MEKQNTELVYVCPSCGWLGDSQESHNLHVEGCYGH